MERERERERERQTWAKRERGTVIEGEKRESVCDRVRGIADRRERK